MDDFIERIHALRKARALSTWGPDFNDEIVSEAWIEKLAGIPLDTLQGTLDKLSGKKDFPCPADILEVSRAAMKLKDFKKGECTECQRLISEICKSEPMQELKKSHIGDHSKVYEELLLKVNYTPSGKCNLELLQRYASDASQMIFELHWKTAIRT